MMQYRVLRTPAKGPYELELFLNGQAMQGWQLKQVLPDKSVIFERPISDSPDQDRAEGTTVTPTPE